MAMIRENHEKPDALEAELKNIDTSKEQAFVYMATRAPNSSDRGPARVWVHKNGSSLDMYLLDLQSGDWRGPVSFT